MYDEFRPLFVVEKENAQEEDRNPQEDGAEVIDEKERELLELRDKVRSLSEEKDKLSETLKALGEERDKLKAQVESLQKEREELLKRIEELSSKVSQLESSLEGEKLLKKLTDLLKEEITKGINNSLDTLRREFVELTKEALRELLLNEELPIDELAEEIVKSAFEELTQLRGSVKVYVSPEDYDRIGAFILELKAGLGETLDISHFEDKGLKRGEIRIDTPRLVVERRHEEYLEEVMGRVIRNVFKGS